MVDRAPKKRVGLQPKKTWRDKIELEITKLTTNISIIAELQKESNVKYAEADKIRKKLGIKNQDYMAKTKDSLKKQLQAKAQRLRRYTKRANVFRSFYRNNAKKRSRHSEQNMGQQQDP